MYERFTDRARIAMNQTREIAHRFNQATIQPEHLLLGLLEDRDSVAASVLKDCGVELDVAEREIESLCGGSETPFVASKWPPQSHSAKRVIELGMEEARSTNQQRVGTEHVLVGCLGLQQSPLARAFVRLGLTVENAQAAIAELYSQGEHERLEHAEAPREPSTLEALVTGAIALFGLAALGYGVVALLLEK